MDIRNFPQVLFQSWLCRVIPTVYSNNGSLGLMLKEVDTGESIAVATINMTHDDYAMELSNKHQIVGVHPYNITVYIKDYSENQGMLVALQKAGIVSDVIEYVESGYITAPLVYILNESIIDWFTDEIQLNEVMIPGV